MAHQQPDQEQPYGHVGQEDTIGGTHTLDAIDPVSLVASSAQAPQIEYYQPQERNHQPTPVEPPVHQPAHQPRASPPGALIHNARLLLEPYQYQYQHIYAPELLDHRTTGDSVIEPDSVLDPSSGRFYHGKNAGKYLLPNDEVSCIICLLGHDLNPSHQTYLPGNTYFARPGRARPS